MERGEKGTAEGGETSRKLKFSLFGFSQVIKKKKVEPCPTGISCQYKYTDRRENGEPEGRFSVEQPLYKAASVAYRPYSSNVYLFIYFFVPKMRSSSSQDYRALDRVRANRTVSRRLHSGVAKFTRLFFLKCSRSAHQSSQQNPPLPEHVLKLPNENRLTFQFRDVRSWQSIIAWQANFANR